jgi:hypothetical protein
MSFEDVLDDMERMLGPLPNPFQEPIRFRYYVKIWHFYKQRENKELNT